MPMKAVRRLAVGIAALLLLNAVPVYAAQMTLAWDANTEPDIAGYIVEYGPSSAPFTTSVNVGNVTTWTFTNATAGTTYSFRVRAYNTSGAVSNPSASVSGAPSAPLLNVDTPASTSIASTAGFAIDGWAADTGASTGTGIDGVVAWAWPSTGAPAIFAGSATLGISRPDVGAYLGSQFTPSGYHIQVTLAAGSYVVAVYAHSAVSGAYTSAVQLKVTVQAPQSAPRVWVDAPGSGQTVTPSFVVSGWAIDAASTSGPGIDAVHVWAYPSTGAAAIFAGAATYGASRPDVAAAFGSSIFTPSGFSLQATLAPGNYTLAVYAHSSVTATWAPPVLVKITAQVTSIPLMSIDTPTTGALVTQSLTIAGWAVDAASTTGTGVDAVHVWAYPSTGASPFFVGVATYGISRPDVAAALGASRFAPSGFSLQAVLPTGSYTLAVFEHSTLTGTFTPKVTTITVR